MLCYAIRFNQAKPKTDVEARVYEVLSHKNWGSPSSLMHEVARDTFDIERFHVVTRLMWEGMENQRPAAWRIVFKALTLLEFLVKNGAERCVDDARNHGHVLRSLGQFNYYEGTIDRGLGVREKAKQIMEILADDERIREERQKARKLREKFGGSGAAAAGGGGQYAGYGNQEAWNSGAGGGGGYGDGGLDSPYESGGGYSGRYGGSTGNDGGRISAGAPTFAAMPNAKPKKTKKKKKKAEAAPAPPAPAPAPGKLIYLVLVFVIWRWQILTSFIHCLRSTEVDLFSFDVPAPEPAPAAANDDFGAFHSTPAADDDFGAFVASKTGAQPDPFAAPNPATQPSPASFDAFGNSNNNNNNIGMNNMTNAFGNMNMAQQPQPQMQQTPMMGAPAGGGRAQPQMQQQTPMMGGTALGDDDFGDFADAAPKSTAAGNSKPSDPMAKLVSLDGLSKNTKNMPRKFASLGTAHYCLHVQLQL